MRIRRILLADKDRIEAFLVQCELGKLNVPFTLKRVETAADLQRQVCEFRPDVIITQPRLLQAADLGPDVAAAVSMILLVEPGEAATPQEGSILVTRFDPVEFHTALNRALAVRSSNQELRLQYSNPVREAVTVTVHPPEADTPDRRWELRVKRIRQFLHRRIDFKERRAEQQEKRARQAANKPK
ncbi:MAG: hypothetical protein AB1813_04915 [Verrucomicrobiota bacterium]